MLFSEIRDYRPVGAFSKSSRPYRSMVSGCPTVYIHISKSFFDECGIKENCLITKILMDFRFFVKIPVAFGNTFGYLGVF